MTAPAERVAVVGAGPRAAFALERLATLSKRHRIDPPRIDVIAPGRDIGPGEIYAADQPAWLRLNVSSSSVHAWPRDADPSGPSLDEWRERRQPGSAADQFPPRPLVGQYLSEVGQRACRDVGARRLTGSVTAIARAGDAWEVQGQVGRTYDEVLLATGHASDWPGSLQRRWNSPIPLAPRVFPVAELRDTVPDRDGLVVVRGAALTAIDAVLALTVDRAHPATIILSSRTGRLMTPKPEPQVLATIPDGEAILERGRQRLADLSTAPKHVLLDTASALYAAARRRHQSPIRRRAVNQAAEELATPVTTGHAAWLREQLAMATGEVPPDGSWALGQAWRGLYPALIARQARLADTDQPTLGWSDYQSWAAGLERLAFGPPLVNARYLLEMLESRQVEVRVGGQVSELAQQSRAVAVVDGVLPPPGIRDTSDPLICQLLTAGAVSVQPHGRGMRVTSSAQCRGMRGQPTPGLSAVGRLTEDVVLGNDTLVRTHHAHLDRWAHRVLGLAEEPRE